ncbi:motility protein A [Clostridium beijerinckii]|uniref:motility protein A n=1 Tax=Clostridium beijerinckii TaxID=1520 RepID=UPI00098CC1C0|nr:motility protein A [Clostridium beijerinckii]NRT76770.1 chemotaxis protein MotA [Clostridium beijerinckii]OOM50934.1 chemotaxis protein PomA [Clostridium beijerinckii]
MDIMTILSVLFAFICIIVGFIIEGGNPVALLQPTAAMIVIGGTIGAVGISFPSSTLKKFPRVLAIAFKKKDIDLKGYIAYFKEVSLKTRRDGLLSLESELTGDDLDPFIKKGLQMVVDGIDPSSVKSILNTKLEQLSTRHENCIEMFTSAGGYAPTMGIVGTITSLVIILSSLSDVAAMGEKIAVAFVATLYGLATANLFWLPIASKLREIDKEEIAEKEMIIEAVLLIQEGVNPNTLVSKLVSYLTEDEARDLEEI